MEPVKIRGTWRFVDSNGIYHRMTDEEYNAYNNGVVAAPIVEEPAIEEPAPTIEDVYRGGLFSSGNK